MEASNLKYRYYSVLTKNVAAVLLALIITLQAYPNIIEIGGLIEQNTVWTSNDTVVVYADLIVPLGISLIIEGGAKVRLNINTGITINEGSLLALGSEGDSVFFVPNHSVPGLTWKWKGIIIKGANIEAQSKIKYSNIVNAETGIRIEDSYNVEIINTSVSNCQNIGIQLVNSSNCYLVDCSIKNNYDGIEILAPLFGRFSNNLVYNCLLKNQNNNIFISIESGGVFQSNFIARNTIETGINGVWVDNTGGSTNSQNIIEENVFVSNGFDIGYGLYLESDSIIVRNNIFWDNNIAIYSGAEADNCSITENSFYQNGWAIAIGPGSDATKYNNNTFLLNNTQVLGVKETNGVVFGNNNILHTNGSEDIVVNNTSNDLLIEENYWGTTDTLLINRLIYDKNDNPDRGLLMYRPFLDVLDTSNPISPPYRVIKQFVNNEVQISWLPNQESDLKGYKVYYEDYKNYSFSKKDEVGIDTTFTFTQDISVYAKIAVTAFDSVNVPINAQVTGNESPYSFAVLYPYSGPDTIICKDLDKLEISHSNIPMAYNSLFWSTSGDGYFSNSTTQYSTYFPGYFDVESGGAIISLNVIVNNDTLVDKFNLLIIDDPVAFAGNDTTVIADTEILLSEAIADNYDNVLWFTSGDGVFNNDALVEPIYYPGTSDNQSGAVHLEMIVYSLCGYSSDTITINIEPYFSVEGRVWANNKSINESVVVAFQQNSEGARAIQIENTNSDGSFKFEKLMIGHYYMYALPDTNNIDLAVAGYYANKLKWQSAYLLHVDADVFDIDIYLPSIEYALPSGEAAISGQMVMPPDSKFNSEVYCSPWFENSNNDFCIGGLSNVSVFLFNESRSVLLDYTLTNQFGNFYFNQLPFGNYVVDAEKAGLVAVASPIIRLSPNHKNETDVVLEISQQKIGIYIDGEVTTEDRVDVFPNPAHSEITLPIINSLSNPTKVEIYNIFGNRVLLFDIPTNSDISNINIDINQLVSGVYIGHIINPDNTIHFRFIKK